MRRRSPSIDPRTLLATVAITALTATAAFADTPIWSIIADGSTLASDTPIWSISGPAVLLTVPNVGVKGARGLVTVTAVVDGALVAGTAAFECNGKSSTVVSVTFAGPVQSVGSVSIIDDPNPF